MDIDKTILKYLFIIFITFVIAIFGTSFFDNNTLRLEITNNKYLKSLLI